MQTRKRLIGGRVLLAVLLLVLAITPIVEAQGESFGDTFTLNYPDDWDLKIVDEDMVQLTKAETTVMFYSPAFVEDTAAATGDDFDDLVALLEALDLVVGEDVIDPFGDIVAGVTISQEDRAGYGLLINTEDGPMLVVILGAAVDDEDVATALGIIATNYGGEMECIISTTQARTVQVHVGPGANRTVVAFLAANTEFVAEGQANDNAGAVWYRLNVDEAAAGSGANEAWVAAEDVDAAGNCENVAVAVAPPIIPITAPRPVATPGGTGGASGAPIGTQGHGLYITYPTEWQSQLPADIRARSEAAAMYTAYAVPQMVTVESATYIDSGGGIHIRSRVRVDYLVVVTDVGSGAMVGQTTLTGSEPPPFPSTMLISGTLNGNPPTFADALPFFQSLPGLS